MKTPGPRWSRRKALLGPLFAGAGVAWLQGCGGGGSDPGPVASVVPPPGPAASPPPAPNPAPPVAAPPAGGTTQPAWSGFARTAQHDAQSPVAAQSLQSITWSAPVDLSPPYSDNERLLGHYGAPVITANNTLIFAVRTGADNSFRIEARRGNDGSLVWSDNTSWKPVPASWLPAMNPSLTPQGSVMYPLSGGRVAWRQSADDATSAVRTLCFYGDEAYAANPAAHDATVFINTPLVSDRQGNVFFGFAVTGANPTGLAGGVVRLGVDGTARWVRASAAANSSAFTKTATNSAPALSQDETTLYVAVNQVPAAGARARGRLLALDAGNLSTQAAVDLIDPLSQASAWVNDNGTASPTVGPDGDVYFGVLESSGVTHNFRGWLLHFDATLSRSKTPGSFGWDHTASVVPRSMLPSYRGDSAYLLVMKDNSYDGVGTGDGRHLVSIVDPNATQADRFAPAVTVMKELISVLGPTPDPNTPGGVREWCFNSAVVDVANQSVLMNNEDGHAYRWHLPSNTLSERISLNNGYLQAYTPTTVGPDGKIYTINNAVLFALGR
jgi:hypothetical protein